MPFKSLFAYKEAFGDSKKCEKSLFCGQKFYNRLCLVIEKISFYCIFTDFYSSFLEFKTNFTTLCNDYTQE